MVKNATKLELVEIESLVLDPANVRKHDERNIDAIKASLTRFGQQHPIIVNGDGVVVAGNGRLMAAKSMGWKKISVMRTELKGSDLTAFAIADNRTAELASWDDDGLAQTLAALQNDEEYDHLVTGFDDSDIEALINEMMPPAEIVEDEVPEPPVDPITQPGDLWIMGGHRLLCGDSTKGDDVGRVMGGKKAAVLIADPPYGMNLNADYSGMKGERLQGKAHAPVVGDDKPFDASAVCGCDGLEQFWFGADYYASSLGDTEHTGAWLVWDKRLDDSADKMFGSCFEMVWCSSKRKRDILRHKWAAIFTNGEPRSFDHPTTKSVNLICDLIGKAGDTGDIFDPFLGSGTTLIAAEQLGRKCYGIEISPAYCDVIVQRWENLTGEKAVLNG